MEDMDGEDGSTDEKVSFGKLSEDALRDGGQMGTETTSGSSDGTDVWRISESHQVIEHVGVSSDDSLVDGRGRVGLRSHPNFLLDLLDMRPLLSSHNLNGSGFT
jgi:hypothetical protein